MLPSPCSVVDESAFRCDISFSIAEKRKLVDFEGEMLLQGAHNDVDVVIL